jgi:hypothetical protein
MPSRGSGLIDLDLHEFERLALFFKQFPQEARKATAQLLNDLAFFGREQAIDTLSRHGLIIRNRRFDVSRMRVQKTTARPIEQQAAILGSIFTRGKGGHIVHDGWRSLWKGEPIRSRVLTLLARGGERTAIAKAKARLRPGSDFVTPDDVGGNLAPQSRIQALIRDMAQNAPNTPFLIPQRYKGTGFHGLYRVVQGQSVTLASGRTAPKIKALQVFGKQPRGKRVPWMQETLKTIIHKAPIAFWWKNAMDEAFNRSKG